MHSVSMLSDHPLHLGETCKVLYGVKCPGSVFKRTIALEQLANETWALGVRGLLGKYDGTGEGEEP